MLKYGMLVNNSGLKSAELNPRETKKLINKTRSTGLMEAKSPKEVAENLEVQLGQSFIEVKVTRVEQSGCDLFAIFTWFYNAIIDCLL